MHENCSLRWTFMIMNEDLDSVIRQWTSVGAGFDAEPSGESIDIERLLLDTARHAPGMARLFIVAATWLHQFGDLIARHRLKRLVSDELEPEHHAILGLLLDTAQQGTHPPQFQTVIKQLKPLEQARPLFDSGRKNARLARLARRRASSLSRKWNLWCQPVEFKSDAIRPASWMIARHPQLRTRADFRGDLRASILAALHYDRGAGESELRLAELAGGSRSQVRNALRNLVMTGRVTTRRVAGANRRQISLARAA